MIYPTIATSGGGAAQSMAEGSRIVVDVIAESAIEST
jgi:hypothetical protein